MPVRLETRGKLAVVTIDRPERRNAFNEQLWLEFGEVGKQLQESIPRAVVLTGAGDKAFSAGQDVQPDNPQIARLMSAVRDKQVEPAAEMLQFIHDKLTPLFGLPVPVIAAVNGVAFGGGAEIAARCDLRVMDPEATICFSETRLGLMPDFGGGVALTRVVGQARATDLILTARRIHAPEALSLGLVNRISEPGKSVEVAVELAEQIAANGPRAVRSALHVIRTSGSMTWDDAVRMEVDMAAELIASAECTHGITAFMTRTKPEFPDLED